MFLPRCLFCLCLFVIITLLTILISAGQRSQEGHWGVMGLGAREGAFPDWHQSAVAVGDIQTVGPARGWRGVCQVRSEMPVFKTEFRWSKKNSGGQSYHVMFIANLMILNLIWCDISVSCPLLVCFFSVTEWHLCTIKLLEIPYNFPPPPYLLMCINHHLFLHHS